MRRGRRLADSPNRRTETDNKTETERKRSLSVSAFVWVSLLLPVFVVLVHKMIKNTVAGDGGSDAVRRRAR